jgi:hypothetical protein
MILQVDFGAAQTGVGYRFYGATGAFVGARITSGISAGPQTGVYLAEASAPSGAVGVYWDCADASFTSSEAFDASVIQVDFGAAQTGIGYRFYDELGAYVGARVTSGIYAAPQTGVYLASPGAIPGSAIGVYWDCADANFSASEEFAEVAPNTAGSGTGLGDELADDLAAAIADYEQTFTWHGSPYDCVINHETSILSTAKSLFAGAVYPQIGDTIRVAGVDRQIKQIGKAGLEAKAGGFQEDRPFVNDPSSPGLDIMFGTFAR